MKKILSFFLAALLLCSLFAGCGKQAETPETTETKPQGLFAEDPADDGVLRILMIGNSGCYYYTDELTGMLKATGIEADVCNLYYSGCNVQQHWTWLQDGSAPYEYYVKTTGGQSRKMDSFTIDGALADRNWDIVTLQQAFWPEHDVAKAKERTLSYSKNLFDYIRSKLPQAELLWHQTWAYQVGYDWRAGKNAGQITPDMKVLTVEKQAAFYEVIRTVSNEVCQQNAVPYIPVSDAWQIARKHPAIGDVLCDKKAGNGDDLHDGDTGGGQYLNACVWFEIVTGQSCIGNTFRPTVYELSEEKVAALQASAHEAVQNLNDK